MVHGFNFQETFYIKENSRKLNVSEEVGVVARGCTEKNLVGKKIGHNS